MTGSTAGETGPPHPRQPATVEFSVAHGLGVIRLNRPDARNAIDPALVDDLLEAVQRCTADAAVRALLICANGPPVLYRIGGKDVDVTGGGWGFLLSRLTRHGARLLSGLADARRDEGLPDGQLSTADWLSRFTKNESVHGIFRSMCGSVFAVGPDELPARVFLSYFTRKSAFKTFGFCPQGTIGIWESLAKTIVAAGGQVWLRSEVRSVTLENGLARGAVIERGGPDPGTEQVTAKVVISDAGPAATVRLVGEPHLPSGYIDAVKRADRPCAMISVNFASREPLLQAPGLLSFATTRRLCYAANFTATCPEMAPDGWHLYVGTAVPRDDWPPQRAVAGFDLPRDTPVANLWNVGDGVKEYANGGTTACAETAKLVADQVAKLFPVATTT